MNTWKVYWDGGKHDGETIGIFPDIWQAEDCAWKTYLANADECDPGGCMPCVVDENGNVDIDW